MVDVQELPAGWDCRLDNASGRYYYINHQTKTTTWEDPRMKARIEYIPLQDLSNSSPKQGRSMQDTTLTAIVNTEEAVTKISAMFPTVSDTHIRLLLKKYHNREALVISALQVEKHPITTPGPFATPPPTRTGHMPLQMTPPPGILRLGGGSRGSSPILRPGSGGSEAYRNSPKPHSPKLKLRYMKSIFPKAEETLILDLLSGNENNIQKVSEALKDMGFERRDSTPKCKVVPPTVVDEPEVKTVVLKVLKSLEEKKQLVLQLQNKYKDIPEQVVTIALESVEYDEDRAFQILNIMLQEETNNKVVPVQEVQERDVVDQNLPKSQSRQSLKSLLKIEKSENSMKKSSSFSRVIESEETYEMGDGTYRSANITSTHGANRNIVKGANHDLLLEDYVNWQGPQPSLQQGTKPTLSKGPNPLYLGTHSYQACGPNSNLTKGPQPGLAKGSIFTRFRGASNSTEVRSK